MESLYRKYRPQTFADVVGQQHVVGTLQRAVVEGRTSHAYLFCGPRGTGKTTMARLLAKSLMCERGPAQLPDGTCEQCTLIAAGEHPDVYELDAASRTGVDNVREEIINRVGYAPVRGRYKVYIIDEVHMLTTAAFNALLKTLEEPPDHVVFVLCTTDPQKIPATILSRVQRFDFRPISNEDIRLRLAYVCQQEGFTFEDAALDLVVSYARGGMRDALSTLEQLSVFGGGSISTEAAQDLLGAVPGAEMTHVVEAIAARDVPMLFLQVGEMIESGRDPLQFARDLAAHMRDVYVVAAVGPRPEVLDASADVGQLRSEAEAFGSTDRIARILTILGDLTRQMVTAPNQRLVLEIAFTRMARPQEDLTLESLAERVAELERRPLGQQSRADSMPQSAPSQQSAPASRLEPVPTAQPTGRPAPASASTPEPVSVQQPAPASMPGHVSVPQPVSAPASKSQPQAPVSDSGELQRRWRQVVSELMARIPARGSLLGNATALSDDGQTLVVGLPKGSSFALKMLERPDVRAIVEDMVAQQFGARSLVYREGLAQTSSAPQPAPQWSAPAQPAPVQTAPQWSAPEPSAPMQQAQDSRSAASYPMPWDPPADVAPSSDPGPDYVPYEEFGYVGYDEPDLPQPAVQISEPQNVAPQPVVREDFGSPRESTVSRTQMPPARGAASQYEATASPDPSAPADNAPSTPAPPTPATVAADSGASKPAHNIPDDLPPELAAILANAFEVFGEDVRVKKG